MYDFTNYVASHKNAFTSFLSIQYRYDALDLNIIGHELITKLDHTNVLFAPTQTKWTKEGIKTDLSVSLRPFIANIASDQKIVGIYGTGDHWFPYILFQNAQGQIKCFFKDSLNIGSQQFDNDIKEVIATSDAQPQKLGDGHEQILEFEPIIGVVNQHINCGIFAILNMRILASTSITDLVVGNLPNFYNPGNTKESYTKDIRAKRLELASSFLDSFLDLQKEVLNGKNEEEKFALVKARLNPAISHRVILEKHFSKEFLDEKFKAGDHSKTHTPIDYVQLGDHVEVVKYSATKTAEMNHPNAQGKLDKAIKNALENKDLKSLTEFHSKVYELLEVQTLKYNFHHKSRYHNTQETIDIHVEVWSSDNLLFWLLANNPDIAPQALKKYQVDINTVYDEHGNSLLHVAAIHGQYQFIEQIFKQYKDAHTSALSTLINQRNDNGTNPLGMAFLGASSPDALRKIIKLFLNQKEYAVNEYLNNKQGMDYSSNELVKTIGGFNLLHVTLEKEYFDILDTMFQRNLKLGIKANPNDCVNFRYPTMNPNAHMYSPQKILNDKISDIEGQIAELNENIGKYKQHKRKSDAESQKSTQEGKLKKLKEHKSKLENFSKYHEDCASSSGDSADESSLAFLYKDALMDIKKVIDAAKAKQHAALQQTQPQELLSTPKVTSGNSETEIVVSHFHGVPFMRGQYTDFQRREVGKQIFQMNKKFFSTLPGVSIEISDIETRAVDVENTKKSIHSRTSTASAKTESLYHVVTASQERLSDLKTVDSFLATYLSKCYQKAPDIFMQAIKMYVYNFRNSPISGFWAELNKIITHNDDKEGIDSAVVKYRFPLVSTAKAPDHPVKFAIGNNVEQDRGEISLYPMYNSSSYPKHRLAGLLFITSHNANELADLELNKSLIDMTHHLSAAGQSKSSSQQQIDQQVEVTFLGYVDSSNIIAIIPILYPNFSKGFISGYHDDIYGLSNVVPGNDTSNFDKAARVFKGQQFPACYDGGSITAPGKVLMPAFVNLARKLAQSIAALTDQKLHYIASDGSHAAYPEGYYSQESPTGKKQTTFLSEAQIKIRAIVPTTPDKLRTNLQLFI